MSCCDSFGRCTNGDNCPVRRANSMPIQHNSDGSDPGLPVVAFPTANQWLEDMLYSLVGVAGWALFIALLAGVFALRMGWV